MTRDRLVCGVANSSIQCRLLAEQSLMLKQAHDLARVMETAEQDVKDLQGQKPSPKNVAVHMVTHKQRGAEHKTGTENPRHWCGGKHLPQQCSFKTSVCHACKKHGHLARMCRSRKLQGGRSGQGQGSKAQPTHLLESGEVEPHTAESYTLFPVQSQSNPGEKL